jgi:hypothetical protein
MHNQSLIWTHLFAAIRSDATEEFAPCPTSQNDISDQLERHGSLSLSDTIGRIATQGDEVDILQSSLRLDPGERRDVILDQSRKVDRGHVFLLALGDCPHVSADMGMQEGDSRRGSSGGDTWRRP